MRYRRAVEKLRPWARRAKQSRDGRPGIRQRSSFTCDSASYITLTYDPCARAQRAETPDFVTRHYRPFRVSVKPQDKPISNRLA